MPHLRSTPRAAFAAFLALAPWACPAGQAPQATACRQVPLQAPTQFETLGDGRPALRWLPQEPGPYRVQVAVLVPESRIVASHDVEVEGSQWTFPMALPVERAAVKVLVSQGCPQLDAQDLNARGAWFFVDQRAACAIEPGSLRTDAGRLAWAQAPGAQSYRVRLLRPPVEAADAFSLVQEARPGVATWALPPGRRPGDLATVQPVCASGSGRPVALELP